MFSLKIALGGFAAIIAGLMLMSNRNPAIEGTAWKGPTLVALGVVLIVFATRAAAPVPDVPFTRENDDVSGPSRWLDSRRFECFERAFSTWTTVRDGKIEHPVLVEELGNATIRSRRVVALDPLGLNDTLPFTRSVPNGDHPVVLAIVEHPMGPYPMFAKLLFSGAAVVRWEMATTDGEDVSQLKPHEYFGFGVDSGTGAFVDADVVAKLKAVYDDSMEEWDEIGDRMCESTGSTFEWEGASIPLFLTGGGDGRYPCYFGIAEDDTPVCLIADFNVIDPAENVET